MQRATLSPVATPIEAGGAQAAQAVHALLAQPDALDDRDAAFLRRLAGIPPAAWGPHVTQAVWDLLGAHPVAAIAAGISPPAPPPAAPPDRRVRALWAEDGQFVLAFSFDEHLHAAARALPERHYDPARKCWVAHATPASARALTEIAARFGFVATAEAAELLAAAAAGRTNAPLRRIERTNGQWRIVLPPPASAADWSLLSDVRSLPERRFHPETDREPAHWTLADDADGLAHLVDLVDVHGDRLHISAEDRALLGAERAQALDASANVTLGADGFELSFDYDAATVEQVKAITGREFDRERRVWTIPRAVRPALQLAALLATTRLTINDEAAQALHELRLEADRRAEQQIHLFDLSLAHDADLTLPEGLGVELHPFQRAGVQYILTARRTLVADSQGLGKTVQCLAGIHADNAFPALIVAPATLKLTWRDEAQRALPGRGVVVLAGETPDPGLLDESDLAIINYDVLQAWLKTLRKVPWNAIVGDEAHKLKEQGQMKGKQLRGPPEATPSSASPVPSHAAEASCCCPPPPRSSTSHAISSTSCASSTSSASSAAPRASSSASADPRPPSTALATTARPTSKSSTRFCAPAAWSAVTSAMSSRTCRPSSAPSSGCNCPTRTLGATDEHTTTSSSSCAQTEPIKPA